MKFILAIALFMLCINIKAQTVEKESVQSKVMYQLGYISELVEEGRVGLQGLDMQVKYFISKSDDSPSAEGTYINPGYCWFTGDLYSLNQLNLNLGFYFASFVAVPMFKVDMAVGATYYFGTIENMSFSGKTVDLGFSMGASLTGKKFGGIYMRFSMPGVITSLAADDYFPPSHISLGLQF